MVETFENTCSRASVATAQMFTCPLTPNMHINLHTHALSDTQVDKYKINQETTQSDSQTQITKQLECWNELSNNSTSIARKYMLQCVIFTRTPTIPGI